MIVPGWVAQCDHAGCEAREAGFCDQVPEPARDFGSELARFRVALRARGWYADVEGAAFCPAHGGAAGVDDDAETPLTPFARSLP